mmetsp:Transcript_2037/g.4614  ORF Transcript_2037/g.4614 Transcript_2037/m.4614 type:complete len:327 (-) Transcript_2037:335-1315(-)|eukprot:CAMPEP_0171493998 /NCGR_PEP_ID=MMETSP0958-20121227/5269_1 /TAXON_ID=87120 /ORGANISM="Aurantiochytrium limacinum, Strain ATCCMYA-1381" /LENGTH=326 /DNA_ID=CAMNT_0012027675 /DNA_START=426 /DNA_END=1406 /DNA_ORIENTATION=-
MVELKELSCWKTSHGGLVRVCAGSVIDFHGDAIVNAANMGGIGGGGIDGAVNYAGGSDLLDARCNLPFVKPGVRIPTGESRMTVSGDLPVDYVIHSVGPCYPSSRDEDHNEEDRQLRAAYVSALELAHKNELRRIAFALISAGVFRGARSLEEILELSCKAIDDSASCGDDISLCAYADDEQKVLQQVAQRVFIPDRRKMSRTGPAPSSPATKPLKTITPLSPGRDAESLASADATASVFENASPRSADGDSCKSTLNVVSPPPISLQHKPGDKVSPSATTRNRASSSPPAPTSTTISISPHAPCGGTTSSGNNVNNESVNNNSKP